MNRISTLGPSDYLPDRWSAGWRAALSGPFTLLLRYVLVLIVLCAIGCLYLWQASDISQLNKQTQRVLYEARNVEATNASLMTQFAQWNGPAYIERQADALGLVPAEMTGVIQMPAHRPGQAPAQPARAEKRSLIQQVTGLLPGQ
jgi:hypothetical protein